MPDGLDWLMRPVLEKLVTYDKYLDGTISLEDVSILNEALDVRDENASRANKAAREAAARG